MIKIQNSNKYNFSEKLINVDFVKKLIIEQFPEYSHLSINPVEQQGHDNRTFRLGNNMLVRLPSAEYYALKVAKEQELLPLLKSYLSIDIPAPIKMGNPSCNYPFHFSIYKWLNGTSANQLNFDDKSLEIISLQLANFLKELHSINNINGPPPGKHNGWGGGHLIVKDIGARSQISELGGIIDGKASMEFWEMVSKIKFNKKVWIHGDFAIGNFLIDGLKLSGVIDFGGMAIGDPACDLVIAWTFLKNKSRQIFKHEMNYDSDTWLRARGWALWKATFDLCEIMDKNSNEAIRQKKIIEDVLSE